MSHLRANLDRFSDTHQPGWEPEAPNGCIACGELGVDKEGWCPRCNEEYGDKPTMKTQLLSVLNETLEFVEEFVDGATDASPRSKSANYLALQLRAEINKLDKQREDLAPLA